MLTVAYLLRHNARAVERNREDVVAERKKHMLCPANQTVAKYRKAMQRNDWMSKPEIMKAIKTKAVDILGVLQRLREHGFVESQKRYNANGHQVLYWRWIRKGE